MRNSKEYWQAYYKKNRWRWERYNRWAATHPKEAKEAKQKSAKRRNEVIRELIRLLKDVPCADCGRRFPPCAMDFDHVKGKRYYRRYAMSRMRSIDQLAEEVEKCEVVCACCHRIRTENRRLADLK